MVDNIIIIIHLHYIRLGDEMDLFFFFPELFPHVLFVFLEFFFLLFFVETQCFEHLKKKREETQGETKNFMYSDFLFFSFCISICTKSVSFTSSVFHVHCFVHVVFRCFYLCALFYAIK